MKASNFEDFTIDDCNDEEPFYNCDDESYVESGEESENFDEPQNSNMHTFETCQSPDQLQPKLKVFLDQIQSINQRLHKTAFGLVKEANNAGGTGQYALNSYAFHSRSLINTLCNFMPGFDRTKVESILIEAKEAELEAANPLLITNTEEKVRRKRVLISSDYKTAFKVKNIFDVYYELNQSRWCTDKIQNKKFKQGI